MADDSNSAPPDSPEARRYNRIRRWIGIADFVVGFLFLIVLLVTGWSNWLRDLAYRLGLQNYSLSLFIYLVLLLVISKALGIGLDYYGFLLEGRFKLSTQRFSSWAGDELKGFLVGLVLGTVVVEVLYLTIRQWPQHWWMLAWALVMALFPAWGPPAASFWPIRCSTTTRRKRSKRCWPTSSGTTYTVTS